MYKELKDIVLAFNGKAAQERGCARVQNLENNNNASMH